MAPSSIQEDVILVKTFGKVEADTALKNIWLKEISAGYVGAQVDSIRYDSLRVEAYINSGLRYNLAFLDVESIPSSWRPNRTQLLEKNASFLPPVLADYIKNVLIFAENNGYPFASIHLDSIVNYQHTIAAQMVLDKGQFFTFDSLEIIGNALVQASFLENYTGIKIGDPYSEKLVRNIDKKLSSLPFAKLSAATRIYFGPGKVRIQIHLDDKKSDQLDGIIGFAPNSESDNGALLLTGELNIELLNMLRRAMEFKTHWKSFLQQSQQLDVELAYPYLFNTALGVDAKFDLFKYDTTFITFKSNIGTRILFDGFNHVRLFYENFSSTLNVVDTNQVRSSRQLPINNPVLTRSYGADLRWQNLDYIFNPRKGIDVRLKGSVGTKEIERDDRIENIRFVNTDGIMVSAYDALDLKTLQGKFGYQVKGFVPLGTNATWMTSLSGEHLIGKNILNNEIFRFGGNRTLRGFDENALEGHTVNILVLEYRYLLGRDAHFHVFANAAYYENSANSTLGFQSDIPYGFGAGVNLEVGNGVLRLDYALGSQKGNPIEFGRAKVHFGLINYL
jgi:outer membrane protein assembly factor BamA